MFSWLHCSTDFIFIFYFIRRSCISAISEVRWQNLKISMQCLYKLPAFAKTLWQCNVYEQDSLSEICDLLAAAEVLPQSKGHYFRKLQNTGSIWICWEAMSINLYYNNRWSAWDFPCTQRSLNSTVQWQNIYTYFSPLSDDRLDASDLRPYERISWLVTS